MRLWRPVGAKELALIQQSGWRAFPPRLPEQPIFYPVLNFAYAAQIACDCNSTRADSDFVGYVLEFDVPDNVAARYPEQIAGAASLHRELWVPADELGAFNKGIEGHIRLVAIYRGGVQSED